MKNTSHYFLPASLIDLSSKIELSHFYSHFDQLRQDPYVEQGFRFKEINRYRVKGKKVLKQPHGPLFQSGKHNPTHGDIIRDYPTFDPYQNLKGDINKLVQTFAASCNLTYQDEILFQAQRVLSSKDITGLPAVEGWHQDGTTYIGMFCVQRENVAGGSSQLSFDKGENKVFDHILQPGELLILDDRTYWHYATAIQPILEEQKAYRDIIILCTPSCRQIQEHGMTYSKQAA